MLTSGTKLGPYEILSPLGAGGMGEVYRATDLRLGRDVALKVLPAETAHDPQRLARFEREARAVAAINHPHIVTIFSVEEAGGVRFLTMELVEGRSLAELIPEGGLPVERLVEIGGSLAEALAAAHEKGIMHRDLKPANVMVAPDGRVKVLDFGLAKETRADPGDATASLANTQAGVVMGTPAYMSPEQLMGRVLDARTDIFSLGVMLHEMATGRRPFNGDCSAELTSAILRDTPPLVTDLRADLPGDLARVIRRCLEKDPGKRIQTARDVGNEFRDLAQLASRTAPALSSASHAVATPGSGAARTAEGFWIAVLPFKCQGTEAGLEALPEGITEGIMTGLSRFSYLRVIAQGSIAKYSGGSGDVRAISRELGARYVVEGSIRQAGPNCRLAVQLVDAVNGTHLWAETSDRVFRPEEIFSLQDQLVPRIVSTVADQHGILVHSMINLIRTKGDEQLSPLEAVLRVFSFHERMTPEEHARVRAVLERTVEQAPDEADCWAMLATLYSDEHMFDFSGQPDPLGRAQAAARRAVGINPSSPLASQALAQSLFFRREWQAFRPVAERTIALNPMDGATGAFMGLLLALSGEWERGCAVVESAMQLNPHFPGWYWLGPVFKAYHECDYRASADLTLGINMPGYFWGPATSAAAFGQLGELETAQKSLKELLAIRPGFGAKAREEFNKWFDPELVEHYVDGLRKAGLDVPKAEGTESPTPAISPPLAKEGSGAARAAEAFWVAVLPFRTPGGNADLEALADGLTEDVTAGLSRFPYLQVIAHNSAMAFRGRAADIRTVGRELAARYVLEGSVRKRGRALRVSAELLDARKGHAALDGGV